MTDKPTYEELEKRVRELERAETERKRAEDALRESELQKGLILNSTSELVGYYDTDLRIIWVNTAAASSVGKSPEEMIGSHCYTFWSHSDEPCSDCPVIKAREEKTPQQTEKRTPDGRHWSIRGFPILDKEDRVIGLAEFTRDITERKQAEVKYEALFREMPYGYALHEIICDEAGEPVDYRYLSVNPAFERMTGLKEEDVVGRTVLDVFPSTERHLMEIFAKVALSGEPVYIENYIISKGKHYEVSAFCPDAGQFGCAFLECTERKQIEEALHKSEERFRNIFQHHSAVKLLIDPDTGNIIEANEAAARFYGWPVEELKTMQIQEINVLSEDEVKGEMAKAKSRDRTYFEFQHRLADGSLRDVEVYSSNINVNGKVLIHSIVQDVTERKRTERALVESEFRFRSFVENANDLVYSLSREGEFTYVSPNWTDFMGEPPAEALGRSFEPYAHPDDVHLCRAFLERVLATGEKQSSAEFRVRHCNGTWRWHVSNGSPLWDSNGDIAGYLGIARDITDQKDRELKYAQVLKTAIDGFWLIDIEGRLAEVNDAAAALLGYSPEEMTRLTISDIDAAENPDETRRRIQQLRKEGFARFETRHKRKDGSLIDVEVGASFSPMGGGSIVAFTRDITERKRAEREERLNIARLEIVHKIATMADATEKDICDVVLESMVDLTDSAIGFLGFLSDDEEVMQIHAWSSSAMAECAIHDKPMAFPVDQAGLWGEPVRNRKPMIFNDYEAPHPAKKGYPEGHVPVSRFMAIPVFDGDHIVGVAAVGNRQEPYNDSDVSQLMMLLGGWWEQIRRRRTEREKEALQARLQQSHKMEAIGTLAGGIAHDFNNILSVIVGNAELAMLDLPEWSPAQDSLKEVREASLRARELVKQILLFARQKEHTISNIRLEPIVKESLKMLRASIPSTVEIRENIEEGLPPVLADPSQIQQIIMNLCTNAGQIMEAEGGTLTFTLDIADLETPLHTVMEALPPGRYVSMQVRDTGPGIPPENLGKIFDPFFTTKGVGEGTGLGLAVVHGIVLDRKGGITVESEEGQGTTFTVYLPASEVQSVEVTAEEKMDLPRGTERVLFVDDEPMILKLGQRMLERLGYKVDTRASGTDALECFRQDPYRFDLVVTDMTMPGMRGDRLAEEILAIRPDIPVILCTGYSRQISKEKAREIGIRAFVMKPLTQQELANTAREVLDGKPRK